MPDSHKTSAVMIDCPKCGETYEITEALRESIAEKAKAEVLADVSKREKALASQEAVIAGEKEQMEKLKATEAERVKREVTKRVDEERTKVVADAKKQAQEELRVELKDKEEQIKEKDAALKIAQEAELSARKREREADERIKTADLEVEKKLASKQGEMEVEISKRYNEEFAAKERQNQKKISDLVQQLEEAKIKAEQGSQQLQGEVQELDLEQALREAFPQDVIEPVGKGIRGADIRQRVQSSSGRLAGVILWESKQTKTWSDGWLGKLKDDLRAEAANIPVIVSVAMPEEAKAGFGQKEGVWVCKPGMAIGVAHAFRRQLLDVALANAQAESRGTLADSLYDYVISHEFRQQIESMVEVYREMKEQIGRERIAYEKSWKIRDAQVDRMFVGTARVVGSIQGKLGSTAFGPVKGLELLEGPETE
ncbi:MAG: DUF2130 domain-containing protein [Candidatus Adlerbacteria bacterium]